MSLQLAPAPCSPDAESRPGLLTRLAVVPGRNPEWHPPVRLVGLLVRTVVRAFTGPAATA